MRHILTSFALLALLSACAGTPEVRGTASSKNPGETLPFGAIAEACEVKRRDFGSLIEKQGRWKLYDTRPGAVGPRRSLPAVAVPLDVVKLQLTPPGTAAESVAKSTRPRVTPP